MTPSVRRPPLGRWARSVDDALGALADNGFTSRATNSITEGRAMSHDATNWAIQRRGLKPTTKIVLWDICVTASTPTSAASPRRIGWRMIAKSAGPP